LIQFDAFGHLIAKSFGGLQHLFGKFKNTSSKIFLCQHLNLPGFLNIKSIL